MRRHLPWVLLLLLPCLLFPGALPGPDVVSADDHLTVHHAYQDSAGGRIRHPHLSDPALHFKALRKQVVAALSKGEAPLWNPDIWAGAPLLGDAQSMAGSPVTWLRLVLPEDMAQDAGVAWVLLWLAVGCGLLCRQLGGTTWGSATAGAAAMTGPYVFVWLLHPHAATYAWIPWVLLGIERRSGWITALATAGLIAGGHPATAAHGLALAVIWATWRRSGHWPLLGMVGGGLLAAPIWLPFADEVLRSASLAAHGGNRIEPGQLLDLIWPGWHGHPATETWTHTEWSWANGRMHPGLAALALAGLAAIRRTGIARWLLGGWAACILISVLGLPGPTNNARLAAIGALFIAVGAGLAVGRGWRGCMAMALVGLTGAWAGQHDQGTLPADAHDPEPAAWTHTVREATGCSQPDPDGCGRILGLGWAVQPNTGSLAGLRDLRGYDLPVSHDTERLQMALNPRPVRPWFRIDTPPPEPLLRFASVRVLLSPEELEGTELALENAPLFAAHTNDPMPRAWLATAPRAENDPSKALQIISARADAVSRPPVEGLTGTWPKTGDAHRVAIVRDEANRINLSVNASQPGLVVLADAWHPGWTVQVDGKTVKPLRVGGVFRGVTVTEGAHKIAWVYRPRGWVIGRWMGLLGILLVVTVLRLQRQK